MRKVFPRSRSCLFLDISGNGSSEVVRGWNYNEGLHVPSNIFYSNVEKGREEKKKKRERERDR